MSRRLLQSARRSAGLSLRAAAVAAALTLAGASAARADALVAQPVLGAPANDVTPFGAAPSEAPGSVWAYGTSLAQPVLLGDVPLWPAGLVQPGTVLLHAGADGIWSVAGAPLAIDGTPMSGFRPAVNGVSGNRALAAQMTSRGGGLLLGTSDDTGTQVVLTRDPGGSFREIPAPAVKPDGSGSVAGDRPEGTTPSVTTESDPPPAPATDDVLEPGEQLYSPRDSRTPAAPIDDGDRTGVLIAPTAPEGRGDEAVLHWDGAHWTRETITLPRDVDDLHVVALAAASPADAWLLASSRRSDTPLMLFRRDLSAGGVVPTWERVEDSASPLLGQAARLPAGVAIAAGESGQPLTATTSGVWVDGTITVDRATHDLTFFLTSSGGGAGTVLASWCDASGAAASLCTQQLGRDRVEPEYRSAAWPGTDGDPVGSRIVAGYGNGQLLRLQGMRLEPVLGVGPDQGPTGAIAFPAPDAGWVGGGIVLTHVTSTPAQDSTQPWPVPFRRPLLAIAPEPGRPVGALDTGALAVGDGGQVARYVPGIGWQPEFLLDGNDARATPRLRAVAWPTPDIAYAVGDDGAMWRWRRALGLWESDPGTPLNFDAHLMGIAFDPANPDRGYAVGKDGTLLRYEKSWEPDPAPAGLEHAQFTSLSFAGSQAVATYRVVDPADPGQEIGGLIVNDGGGWRIDEQVRALLAQIDGTPAVLRRVTGLPDGGAVAAGIGLGGVVIERDAPSTPWRFSAEAIGGVRDVVAAAAVREGQQVRAVLSVDGSSAAQVSASYMLTDQPLEAPPGGAPPFLVSPDPLPSTGFLVRETASGWRDEQHTSFPVSQGDGPLRPDSALALLTSASGDAGWVVGGETGTILSRGTDKSAVGVIQTAGVMRYPRESREPPGMQTAPIGTTPGAVTFAVGGGAQCASLCATLANASPGPDRWLPAALQRAAGIDGVSAFLYTGGRLADPVPGGPPVTEGQRATELGRYAELLGSAPALPTFAAAAPADADATGSTAAFGAAFGGFGAPFGGAPAAANVTPVSRSEGGATRTYYSFDAAGEGGPVRAFVLDYSAPSLDVPQLCWLAAGLGDADAANVPAIVVGGRSLSPGLTDAATDAPTVSALLAAGVTPPDCGGTTGRASAYFFNARGENRAVSLTANGITIPSWGTGSLGYTSSPLAKDFEDFSASGFLLASIDAAARDDATNQAPVTVRLIPSIAELALDSTDGTLLPRSEPALFEALARRPRGGFNLNFGAPRPDPYVSIPSRCLGPDCASFIQPDYAFSSSRPDIGDFVRQDPDSPDDHTVLLGPGDKPIPDPTSGLFCPFNAGTTTVSIHSGGLVYSQQVTVEQGSVRRPCGTVPLTDPPLARPVVVQPDLPSPAPGPGPQPNPPEGGATPFQPPAPPVPAVVVPRAPLPTPKAKPKPPRPTPVLPPAIVPPFLVQLPNNGFLPPVIQPPPPPAARPSPPSGTSPVSTPVTQSAVAPEEKREEEVATDMAHNMVAYHPPEHDRFPAYLLGIAALAAIAGVTIRRGGSRDGGTLALSTARAQEDARARRRRL